MVEPGRRRFERQLGDQGLIDVGVRAWITFKQIARVTDHFHRSRRASKGERQVHRDWHAGPHVDVPFERLKSLRVNRDVIGVWRQIVEHVLACRVGRGGSSESMAMQQVTKTERQKIKLIYDGDIGPDPCDFAVLSLLHEYQRHGLIELLGEVCEVPDQYGASTLSIYNQLYKNDVPIGGLQPQNLEQPV